jgi:hypothetical protein
MPAMVRTAAIRKSFRLPNGGKIMAGENLIIGPVGQGPAFVQLDAGAQQAAQPGLTGCGSTVQFR